MQVPATCLTCPASLPCPAAAREYLAALVAYLESFYERTQPLAQLGKHWEKLEAEFAEQWAAGSVPGWEDRGAGGGGAAADAAGALDLDAFDSADELEMLGEWPAGGQLGSGCLVRAAVQSVPERIRNPA